MNLGARSLTFPREAAVAMVLTLLALSVALVVGNAGVAGVPVAVITVAIVVSALLASQAYAGYLLLVICCFTFICVGVTREGMMNGFDLILPFMFPTAFLGALRRQARYEDALVETGPGHQAIREVTRKFTKSIVVFYALAWLSVGLIFWRIGPGPAVRSILGLIRTMEGLMLFPLGMWWLRSERRMRWLIGAALVGGVLLTVVMLGDRIMVGTTRPGMTWVLNQPDQPTEDANQAGLSMVLLVAMVFAQHALKPRPWSYLAWVAAFTVLVLSQSRSGMLALATFVVLQLRRVKIRYILAGAVLIGLVVLLAPDDFFARLTKTVTMKRGSSEVYSWMLRAYGYVANVRAFMDNWLVGTGFLAGQFVTPRYNEFGLPLGAENYFLETAVGMGVIGLAALTVCFVRMFQVGRVVRQLSPPGTLGYHLAGYHAPLLLATMVACPTGNNLVGIVSNAQWALWFALLIRAGHQSLRGAPTS